MQQSQLSGLDAFEWYYCIVLVHQTGWYWLSVCTRLVSWKVTSIDDNMHVTERAVPQH